MRASSAFIAGVMRIEECIQQKLYQQKKSASAARRFSHFFEKAFVNRVKRRSAMRIVKFCLSTCDVQIRASERVNDFETTGGRHLVSSLRFGEVGGGGQKLVNGGYSG